MNFFLPDLTKFYHPKAGPVTKRWNFKYDWIVEHKSVYCFKSDNNNKTLRNNFDVDDPLSLPTPNCIAKVSDRDPYRLVLYSANIQQQILNKNVIADVVTFCCS